jgi:hypothetical protein
MHLLITVNFGKPLLTVLALTILKYALLFLLPVKTTSFEIFCFELFAPLASVWISLPSHPKNSNDFVVFTLNVGIRLIRHRRIFRFLMMVLPWCPSFQTLSSMTSQLPVMKQSFSKLFLLFISVRHLVHLRSR